MSYIRLFFKESLSINLSAKLDKSQSHYLYKVMRIIKGQNFSLFNGSGEWQARVLDIEKGIVNFVIIKKLRPIDNLKDLWLAFTPIKINYLNFMIQKATELGVTKFIPILTERTTVREINEIRLNKIIIEAAEQSNRIIIPSIEKLLNFEKFLKMYQNTNLIFGDLNSSNNKIIINDQNPACILIGPEGDFTEKEREKILDLKNIQSIKINENILRTETAAISLISIVNFYRLSQ